MKPLVKTHPDATLVGLRERLQKATGVVVSRSTLALTLIKNTAGTAEAYDLGKQG